MLQFKSPPVKCRQCRQLGEAGTVQPYCFPDSEKPVWLHQVGCSETYYRDWREYCATQAVSESGNR
jgi:hypothetical protein